MKDPFVSLEEYRLVRVFGKVKRCKVVLTREGSEKPYTFIFSGKSLLWVERSEDYYGSHHYKGKAAARLERQDWLNGGEMCL